MKDTCIGCQTNWSDIVSEGNRLIQFHQADIIIVQCAVVIGMDGDGLNTNTHFISIWVGSSCHLGFSSQVQSPSIDVCTGAIEMKRRFF